MSGERKVPWYAGEHQDVFFYLMIAIFLLEMAIGGVAFFYGIIHAAPETPGGPPIARFPWLAWALGAVLGPVALLLITHLIGVWVSRSLKREEQENAGSEAAADENLPPGLKRFYASIRHAPTIVLLGAVLLLGASLFFIDGAFTFLGRFATALVPHLPWLAGSVAALLAICFLAHAFLVYRQRKMETEYAWRREVLEKTGLVIMDKSSAAFSRDPNQAIMLEGRMKDGAIGVLDITPDRKELPKSDKLEEK